MNAASSASGNANVNGYGFNSARDIGTSASFASSLSVSGATLALGE
jgi:hypothetical protein